MKIIVNGAEQESPDGMSLDQWLARQDMDTSYLAVAVNGDFVSRRDYATRTLHDGDDIEVLSPRQGG